MKLWQVAWKSKLTEKTGHGDAMFKTKEQYQRVCDIGNKEIENMDHWPEEVEVLQ